MIPRRPALIRTMFVRLIAALLIAVALPATIDLRPAAAETTKAEDELRFGLLMVRQRKYDSALVHFTRAIKFGSELSRKQLSRAYVNRGYTYQNVGKPKKAMADYNQAIKIDPKNAYAYNNRGLAFERRGERKRAIDDYRQALKINPKLWLPKENLKRLGVAP